MPKPPDRHKRSRSRLAHPASPARGRQPDSVKDLLGKLTSLGRVSDQVDRQAYWRSWMQAHLPAELCPHLSGVAERAGTLTLFAASAAWAARLRFAVRDLEPQIRAARSEINRVSVRVLPV